LRAIGPELGEHAREVAAAHHVGRVGLARGGVERVTCAVVASHAAVAKRPWRNVDRDAVVWCELAGFAENIDDLGDELRFVFSIEPRGRSWVEPRQRWIGSDKRERPDAEPLGTEERLNDVGRQIVLRDGVGDGERLPAVDVHRERSAFRGPP
jgi:hypothetical protein